MAGQIERKVRFLNKASGTYLMAENQLGHVVCASSRNQPDGHAWPAQVWELTRANDNLYYLVSAEYGTTKNFIIAPERNANVTMGPFNENLEMAKWEVTNMTDNHFSFRNAFHKDCYLDLSHGSRDDRAPVLCFERSGPDYKDNQHWWQAPDT